MEIFITPVSNSTKMGENFFLLTIQDDYGNVVFETDLSRYNLADPWARVLLMAEIRYAIKQGSQGELTMGDE